MRYVDIESFDKHCDQQTSGDDQCSASMDSRDVRAPLFPTHRGVIKYFVFRHGSVALCFNLISVTNCMFRAACRANSITAPLLQHHYSLRNTTCVSTVLCHRHSCYSLVANARSIPVS